MPNNHASWQMMEWLNMKFISYFVDHVQVTRDLD
jgi:hypothetical protein